MERIARLRTSRQIATPGAEVNPSAPTLLLTRPAAQARRFAHEAQARLGPFAQVIVSPLMEIVPTEPFPAVPEEAELAFTSENAVAVAAPRLGATGRRAWCVGDRTAAAARAAGFDAVSAGGDAAALAALIARAGPSGEILHLSGRHQRGDLAAQLAQAGLSARRVPVYDQAARPLSAPARAALEGPAPVLVPLFSPRSAALLSQQMAPGARAPLLVAALSPAVASAWTGPEPESLEVAERPDADALLAALAQLVTGRAGA
jgi:uroporphyrinogen-III synthase